MQQVYARENAVSPVITPASDGIPLVAYTMLDESGGVLGARHPHAVFYAASTVKLGIMLAVALAVERGELSLDDSLECRRVFECRNDDGTSETFRLAPEDSDQQFPADGALASIRDLVAMMIARSSNEATNVLFDRLGVGAIAEAFRLCGADDTRMERRIGDPCAARAGLTNETTPADLAAIMRVIVEGELTSAGSTDWMCRVLETQEHPRIGSIVAPGVPWGSKSGDVPGVEHDVAFVGQPGSRRFVAVCTRGFEPEQGREVIRGVADALLQQ